MSTFLSFPHAPLFRFEIPKTESMDSVSRFVFTLDSIVHLFQEHYPELVHQTLMVTIPPELKTPMYLRQLKMICLTTHTSHWDQAAYQFSHELCHYVIPYDVNPSLRWLEESICQTASIFFLPRLTDYWNKVGVLATTSSGDPYANCFAAYAKNEAKDASKFDVHDPTEIKNLESDCYLRTKNQHVANLLLPIFERHPTTWEAVPVLCAVQDFDCLRTALDTWISKSPPETLPGLQQIRSLFFD